MPCATACVSTILAPQLGVYCTTKLRKDCNAYLVGFRCDLTAAQLGVGTSTAICTNIANQIIAGRILRTPKLKLAGFGAPTFTTFAFSDCDADQQVATAREFTADDVSAIDFNPATGSDTNLNFHYFDYEFYKTLSQQGKWNFGHISCSGKLFLHVTGQVRDIASTNAFGITNQGNFSSAVMTVNNELDRTLPKQCIEVKKIKVTYITDPQEFVAPIVDLNSCLTAGLTAPQLDAITPYIP